MRDSALVGDDLADGSLVGLGGENESGQVEEPAQVLDWAR